jgi:hypothetical protein
MFESFRRTQIGDDMHTTAGEHAWPNPEETPGESNREPSSSTHVIGRLRPSLAALMVEAGVASQEQLQQALAEGQQTGERLGEVVLRHRWITEADLANLIARQWDLAFVALSMIKVDERALTLLSQAEAAQLEACPVGFDENRPLVAIADASEARFTAVRERLGANCAFLVTTQSALARLIEQCGTTSVEPQATFSADADPVAMEDSQVETEPDVEPEPGFEPAPDLEPAPAALTDQYEDDSSPAVEQLDRLVEQLIAERARANEELGRCRQRLAELNDEQSRTQESIQSLEARLGHEDEVLEKMRARLVDLNGR